MSSTNERRPRRKFTDEFKAEAVRLVEESGGGVSESLGASKGAPSLGEQEI